uniref:Uncharacterized protein n=1 Tax=Setaria italica TaxID=4555 RepID=K4AJX4_SETIT
MGRARARGDGACPCGGYRCARISFPVPLPSRARIGPCPFFPRARRCHTAPGDAICGEGVTGGTPRLANCRDA